MNRHSIESTRESTRTVARLAGMNDVSGRERQRRKALQDLLAALLDSYGYRQLETPLLEPTELFLRKSGGELASQLYSFTDPGSNAVSLRPEFTSPIMRHYLEQPSGLELPARWQYCGPVFRYDGTGLIAGPGDTRPASGGQFVQIGGELLGASSLMADAELLDLAGSLLTTAGLRGWTLQLTDLDVLYSLLDPVGLSARAREFVVQSVPRLREGREAVDQLMDEGRHLHLIGHEADDDYLGRSVQGLDDDQARVVLLGLLRSNGVDHLGQRTPEEVVERLLRKIRGTDDEEKLRLALELAWELAQVRGHPADALAGATQVLVNAGADESAVRRLEQVYRLLAHQPEMGEHFVFDFGLVRSLAYYNGIIFEVSHPGWPVPLGGGGRYDGLARALGGDEQLPALGFAYNLDALLALTSPEETTGETTGPSEDSPSGVLVLAAGQPAQLKALSAAQELRRQGETAELEVNGRTLEQAMTFAAARGLARVVVVDENGRASAHEVA